MLHYIRFKVATILALATDQTMFCAKDCLYSPRSGDLTSLQSYCNITHPPGMATGRVLLPCALKSEYTANRILLGYLTGIRDAGHDRNSASCQEQQIRHGRPRQELGWTRRTARDRWVSGLAMLSKAVSKIGVDEFTEPGFCEKWSSGNVAKSPNLSANSPKG